MNLFCQEKNYLGVGELHVRAVIRARAPKISRGAAGDGRERPGSGSAKAVLNSGQVADEEDI